MLRMKAKDRPPEDLIRKIGEELLSKAEESAKEIEKNLPWETKMLQWCMANDELKTQIFRFIDVFPSLKNPRIVARHIKEYFPKDEMRLPKEIRIGLALTKTALLTAPFLAKTSNWLHRRIAKLFIGAASIEDALIQIDALEQKNVKTSIDLLGELTTSETEADQYEERYRNTILAIGKRNKGLDFQNLSIKLSALDPRYDPIDPEGTALRVRRRLLPLLEAAKANNVFMYIDMEHFAVRDLTLQIIREILEERTDLTPYVGIVHQTYLTDAKKTAEQLLNWTRKLPHPITIRLVRGAYWDTEILNAQEKGWPVPVYMQKSETDYEYEELTELLLSAHPNVRLAVATHNIRSLAYAMAAIRHRRRSPETLEFQLLFGLGTPLVPAICDTGHPLRIYMPVGDPIVGMAYLVRRLLENVSQQSFVRKSFWEFGSAEKLLIPPKKKLSETENLSIEMPDQRKETKLPFAHAPFKNEPPLDFSKENVRKDFARAIEQVRGSFGEWIPLIINDAEITAEKTEISFNPARSSQVIAKFSLATERHVKLAAEAAWAAQKNGALSDCEYRTHLLRQTAAILRRKRVELAALEVYEVGKPWREADADVAEAIDYLEFYAEEALRLNQGYETDRLSHESNKTVIHPRGVTAVIAPWNFPLAILTGMSAAALAAGNSVILKPAEPSSFIGWKLASAYREAGFPPGTVNFLTGIGSEIGPHLIEDPHVAVTAFTGSRGVGLEIIQRAASANEWSLQIKKVVAEMGGKNAIIIDSSADFDQAVPAVLESAFGYAGQKCSAASRLILVDDIAKPFLKRLIESASSMVVGDPTLPSTNVGPLINGEAARRLHLAYEEARRHGTIHYRGEIGNLQEEGYFVSPVIVGDLPNNSPLLKEELFGPFLTVQVAKTFEEALKIANDSDYALTGGLFSRTPSHINEACLGFEVGNLYINRKITGAIVRRQPFGGYRFSGGGSKAGGRDYLREFLFIRTITENRIRHGFSPLKLE